MILLDPYKLGTAWTPTSLSNKLLWLDASDPTTINLVGDCLKRWDDKSGNNNHALGHTDDSRDPVYNKRSWSGIAPSVSFNGISQYLLLTSEIPVTNGYNVFAAIQFFDIGTNRTIICGGVSGAAEFSRDNNNYIRASRQQTSVLSISGSTTAANTRYSVFGRTIGAGAGTSVNTGINNVDGTSYGTNPNYLGGLLAVGARMVSSAPTNLLYGQISELIVAHTVSTADRANINSYFSRKWGT